MEIERESTRERKSEGEREREGQGWGQGQGEGQKEGEKGEEGQGEERDRERGFIESSVTECPHTTCHLFWRLSRRPPRPASSSTTDSRQSEYHEANIIVRLMRLKPGLKAPASPMPPLPGH